VKEVYCFGTDKFKLVKGVGMAYSMVAPAIKPELIKHSKHTVKIYNEKTRSWEPYPCNELVTRCPVCGSLMKVYFIPGTTWLALCSKECSDKFNGKLKEIKDVNETLKYFIEKQK